jgi:hypothetical protein
MITVLGGEQRMCSGPTRREALKVGALSLLGGGFSTANLLALEEMRSAESPKATAKRVVLLYLQGGAPTQDMFDMKPDAADDVRGEFQPIDSSAPGVRVCEHLPQTAKWMHKAAVVRSVYHDGGCHKNMPMYTGYDINLPDEEFRDSDPPSMGSVCAYLEEQAGRVGQMPPYVYLPCPLGWGEVRKKGGPHAGFLGRRYDAFSTVCTAYVDKPPDDSWNPQLVRGEPALEEINLRDGITIDRVSSRRSLLDQLGDEMRRADRRSNVEQVSRHQRLAFELLTSPSVRKAFDLSQESEKARERYGRTLFGASTLLARRLVEAGVKFINVSYDNFSKRFQVALQSWDTHVANFPSLKNTLLPAFDQTWSAFIEDLDQRGLLDETLVVVMGEMGRTPKINKDGGRDHWTNCYSVLLAGGGVRGGVLYGQSDRQAAFIQDRPVHIRDICATIYYALGIDPEMTLLDRTNRPIPIAHGGRPVREIF